MFKKRATTLHPISTEEELTNDLGPIVGYVDYENEAQSIPLRLLPDRISDPISDSIAEIERELMAGRRSPEEDAARSVLRSSALRYGSKVLKRGSILQITRSEKFPEGVTSAFHGWQESLRRFNLWLENPHFIVDGIYVASLQEELPDDTDPD